VETKQGEVAEAKNEVAALRKESSEMSAKANASAEEREETERKICKLQSTREKEKERGNNRTND
jgi:hypothetical protein